MFPRPTLPPMRYALFFPRTGAYVREVDSDRRVVRLTADRNHACVLPEPQARDLGFALTKSTGQLLELRA
jgi:hypothetical protein